MLGIAAVGLLLWGTLVEPRRIDAEHEVTVLPGLAGAWEGRHIALVADLQVGMWGANTGTARHIVARLVEARPAAVLVARDFLYKADDDLAEHVAHAVDIVRPLPAAGVPTDAVLGNHDYGMDEKADARNPAMAERLRRSLGQAGVRVLRHEAVPLEPPRGATPGTGALGALYLAGVGSHWAGDDDAAAALAQVPRGAAWLVLMHNPASFTRLRAGAAPVALAAHTHGGRVRLPFTPDWSWLRFVQDDAVHADGWSDASFGAAGNRLCVNRGIGFSDVPIRINCPPELTLLTLRRAAPLRRPTRPEG